MIVIDTNTFSLVFNPKDSGHHEFLPVLQWVQNEKKTCMVYGGTKYRAELKKAAQYLRLFSELKKIGKFVEIDMQAVDDYEQHLENINKEKSFDDKHLAAIINVSGCRLVCTKDATAMPYLKDRQFYTDSKVPKIYSGTRNKDLLNKNNIVSLKNRVK